MDNFSSQLSQILSDPDSMAKIKDFASTLSGEKKVEEPEQPRRKPQKAENTAGSSSVDPELMRSVMKLAPALSRVKQEDNATRLLRALRPFLGESRRRKLDKAVRLMQFTRLVPYLRNCGLF